MGSGGGVAPNVLLALQLAFLRAFLVVDAEREEPAWVYTSTMSVGHVDDVLRSRRLARETRHGGFSRRRFVRRLREDEHARGVTHGGCRARAKHVHRPARGRPAFPLVVLAEKNTTVMRIRVRGRGSVRVRGRGSIRVRGRGSTRVRGRGSIRVRVRVRRIGRGDVGETVRRDDRGGVGRGVGIDAGNARRVGRVGRMVVVMVVVVVALRIGRADVGSFGGGPRAVARGERLGGGGVSLRLRARLGVFFRTQARRLARRGDRGVRAGDRIVPEGGVPGGGRRRLRGRREKCALRADARRRRRGLDRARGRRGCASRRCARALVGGRAHRAREVCRGGRVVVLSKCRALRLRQSLRGAGRHSRSGTPRPVSRPVTVPGLYSAAPRRAPWTRRGAAASPRRARSAPPPQPPPRRTRATSGTTPPPPSWCASGTGDSASRAARPGAPPPAQTCCTGIGSAACDTPRREPRDFRPRPTSPPRRAPDRWEALRAEGDGGDGSGKGVREG